MTHGTHGGSEQTSGLDLLIHENFLELFCFVFCFHFHIFLHPHKNAESDVKCCQKHFKGTCGDITPMAVKCWPEVCIHPQSNCSAQSAVKKVFSMHGGFVWMAN